MVVRVLEAPRKEGCFLGTVFSNRSPLSIELPSAQVPSSCKNLSFHA